MDTQTLVLPQVTVFEQEHFQGKCQEFTSECCNIQQCGFDNIRSIRVESGAWVNTVLAQNMRWGTISVWLDVLFFTAGWVMSTMTSRASSLSWREESTLTGMLTVETCPTTWRDSCLLDPSTALWDIHLHNLKIGNVCIFICVISFFFFFPVSPEQSYDHVWEGELHGPQCWAVWRLPLSAGHGMVSPWSGLHACAVWRVSVPFFQCRS